MPTRRRRVVASQEVVDVLRQPASPTSEQPTEPDPVHPQPLPRPLPDNQLTPDQRRIRELENQLALERGGKDPAPELEAVDGTDEDIVIHFVEDGFTALGQVWYRGQEIAFTRGSGAYTDTCDRHGRTWLDLRADENAQIEKWGKVMFRDSPWPGKSYLDAASASYETVRSLNGDGFVPPPSTDELALAATAEARRRRAAPRLPRA